MRTGEKRRQSGVVKWFNSTKGFGFITPDEGGEEVFVHQTNINSEGFRSLREGERVEFEVEPGPDGRHKAVNVTGPSGAAPQGSAQRPSYRRPYLPVPPVQGARPVIYAANNYYPYATPYPPFMMPGFYYPPMQQPIRSRGPGPGPSVGGPAESSGLQAVVHNLPWTCTWQQLKDAFREFRVERADVVMDAWGRSRGFGTVRFATKEDALAACEKMNNAEIEGRTISVRIDRYA